MQLTFFALATWASVALASPQSNVCTSGNVSKYMSRRNEPCVQLWCSKRLYPNTWKADRPSWSNDLKTCNYDDVSQKLGKDLSGQCETFCKCSRGTLPACPDPLMVRTSDYRQCVCKPGTVSNGKGGCKATPTTPTCYSPKVLSTDKKSCVCSSNLDQVGNDCKPMCRSDQVRSSSTGQCGCPAAKSESYGKCACKQGTNDDGKGGCTTVPSCNAPKVLNQAGKYCVCPSNLDTVGDGCKPKCRADQKRNIDSGECGCPASKQEKSGACVCKTGSDNGKGECTTPVTCSDPKVISTDGKSCVCKTGYGDDGKGGCKAPVTCSDLKVLSADGKSCVCKTGYGDDGKGGCKVSPPSCADPKTLGEDGKLCICKTGYSDDGKGGCKVSPPSCVEPKTVGQDGKSCICKTGYSDDGKGGCKVSPPSCVDPKTIGQDGKSCICKTGTIDDGQGGCKTAPLTCGKPRVLSGDGKSCACPDSMTELVGESRSTCVCKSGTVDDGQGGCKTAPVTCVAPKTPSSDRTSCVCPANMRELISRRGGINSGCECKLGYVDDGNGGCTASPTCTGTGEELNQDGTSCVCQDSFEKVSGECKPKCPAGQDRNHSTNNCECNDTDHQELVAGVCRSKCTGGKTRNDAGDCECPEFSDEVNHVCLRPCSDGARRGADGTCVCGKPNYEYIERDGICDVKCQGGSIRDPNNSQCVCPNGTQWLGGSCVAPCDDGQERIFGGDGTCVPKCASYLVRNPDSNECECQDTNSEDINGVCKPKCGDGQFRYLGNQDCRCARPDADLVNGVCVPKCTGGKTRNDQGQCDCPDGQEALEGAGGACFPKCMTGGVRDALGKCGCPDETEEYQGSCVPACFNGQTKGLDGKCGCSADQDSLFGGCVPKCTDGKTRNQYAQCVCPTGKETRPGYPDGPCLDKCPSDGPRDDQGNCNCFDGSKEVVNGACVPRCPDGALRNDQGQCTCTDTSEEIVNNVCAPKCDAGATRDSSGQCPMTCPANTIPFGGVCSKSCKEGAASIDTSMFQVECGNQNFCPSSDDKLIDGADPAPDFEKCMLRCGDRKNIFGCRAVKYDFKTQICQMYKEGGASYYCTGAADDEFGLASLVVTPSCTGGKVANNQGDCDCPADQEVVAVGLVQTGSCVPKCPSDAPRNDQGQCTCSDISKELISNTCVSKCPSSATRNDQGQCTCTDTSTELVNNACVPKCYVGGARDATSGQCTCPATTTAFGGFCSQSCRDGHFAPSNGGLFTLNCNSKQYCPRNPAFVIGTPSPADSFEACIQRCADTKATTAPTPACGAVNFDFSVKMCQMFTIDGPGGTRCDGGASAQFGTARRYV